MNCQESHSNQYFLHLTTQEILHLCYLECRQSLLISTQSFVSLIILVASSTFLCLIILAVSSTFLCLIILAISSAILCRLYSFVPRQNNLLSLLWVHVSSDEDPIHQ